MNQVKFRSARTRTRFMPSQVLCIPALLSIDQNFALCRLRCFLSLLDFLRNSECLTGSSHTAENAA